MGGSELVGGQVRSIKQRDRYIGEPAVACKKRFVTLRDFADFIHLGVILHYGSASDCPPAAVSVRLGVDREVWKKQNGLDCSSPFAVRDARGKPRANLIPATTYSPTSFPMQYHRH